MFLIDKMFAFFEHKSPGDKLLLKGVTLVCFLTLIVAIINTNNAFTKTVPAKGGVLIEGIVGTPRFVNPVLAINQADKDITTLVYSGLLRLDETGVARPYLAESMTVSNDGMIYNLNLKPGITFHDGMPITADDVLFTVNLIKDQNVQSPLRLNFDGVSVEKISERELNFVLERAFAPFAQNLTFGILPKHIWHKMSAEELPFSRNNIEPIGSGPYRVKQVERNDAGLIEAYWLVPHDSILKQPKIEQIRLTFFASEVELVKAINQKEVMGGAGLSAQGLRELDDELPLIIYRQPLPRTFAVFFNQSKSAAMRDSAARAALNIAVPRQALVDEVLSGYGRVIASPITPDFGVTTAPLEINEGDDPIALAKDILLAGGWQQTEGGTWQKEIDGEETELSIDVVTADSEVFAATVAYLEKVWRELGVQVSFRQLEQTDLIQTVIKPRDYEALLYGTDLGRQFDFYPFWHSDGRNDPGLNISLYTSTSADKLLENLRLERDELTRLDYYSQFEHELVTELPAIFLYVPEFTYVLPEAVQTSGFKRLTEQSERFSTIETWHINSQNLWPIFDIN